MIRRRSLLASLAALLGLPSAAGAARPDRPYRELRNPCLDLPISPVGPSITSATWVKDGTARFAWQEILSAIAYETQITIERSMPNGSRSCVVYHGYTSGSSDHEMTIGSGWTRGADRLTVEVCALYPEGLRSALRGATLEPGRGFHDGLEFEVVNASYIQTNSF